MRIQTFALRFGAALAACVAAGALTPHQAFAAPPAVGSVAPDFSLQTTDGKTVTLSGLRGKVVVVNFFATWCPPCRAETPDLISASNAFAPRDVTFVGVDVKEPAPLVQQFAAAKGVAFTLALDSDAKVNDAYDVRAIPTTYVVGRDGRILYRQVDQLSNAVLAGAINAVLAGRIPNESPLARRFRVAAAGATSQVNALVAQGQTAGMKRGRAVVLATANRAIAIGLAANKKLDDLQNAYDSATINYFTGAQQRDALGLALASAYDMRSKVESGKAAAGDLEQVALLFGQKAEDEERFADAMQYYKNAAQLAPKDTKALDGQYLAAYELRDYATAAAVAEIEARIAPKDPESWLTVASSNNSLKQYDNALAAERTALALAAVDYALHPTKKKKTYEVGRVYLKMGRTAIMADNKVDAATYLANSSALAPGTIVAQQAQEQYAALSPQPVYVAVSGADQTAGLASQPANLWVMVHNAAPDTRMVHLSAVNVPKKWVLSFCYNKVCDPYKSDVSIGPNASRRIELKVVPLSSTHGAWKMQLAPVGVDQMNVDLKANTAKASITVLAS